MKAFILERYGPPETLRMAEVEMPTPAGDEVLVRVLAVSVNPADWRSMRAKPFFSRATLGLLRPKHRILGGDIAGRVEAVGDGVTQFKPGDEVYANLLDHGYGGFAEYVSVPVDVMSLKPANLSFEEAAAVPMAGGNRTSGPSPPRRNPARAAGADQWSLRRHRQLCGPDRQIVRLGGDRGYQHPEPRPRRFPRRRSRPRLHHDGRIPQRAALRPHPRHDRESSGGRSQTRSCRGRQGRRRRVHQRGEADGRLAAAAARTSPWCRHT